MAEEKHNSSETETLLKSYEVGFLVKEEGGARAILAILKRHKAEITFEGSLKTVALEYKIKKESQAWFGHFRFTAPAAQLKEIEQEITTDANVLRALFIKPRVIRTKGGASQSSERPMRPAHPQPASVPLSNEALEKKLEEILQ